MLNVLTVSQIWLLSDESHGIVAERHACFRCDRTTYNNSSSSLFIARYSTASLKLVPFVVASNGQPHSAEASRKSQTTIKSRSGPVVKDIDGVSKTFPRFFFFFFFFLLFVRVSIPAAAASRLIKTIVQTHTHTDRLDGKKTCLVVARMAPLDILSFSLSPFSLLRSRWRRKKKQGDDDGEEKR